MLLADGFVIVALVKEIGSKSVFFPGLGLLYLSFPLIVGIASLIADPWLKLGATFAVFLVAVGIAFLTLIPLARDFFQPILDRYSEAPLPPVPESLP
jgi:hypothetical protein